MSRTFSTSWVFQRSLVCADSLHKADPERSVFGGWVGGAIIAQNSAQALLRKEERSCRRLRSECSKALTSQTIDLHRVALSTFLLRRERGQNLKRGTSHPLSHKVSPEVGNAERGVACRLYEVSRQACYELRKLVCSVRISVNISICGTCKYGEVDCICGVHSCNLGRLWQVRLLAVHIPHNSCSWLHGDSTDAVFVARTVICSQCSCPFTTTVRHPVQPG